MSVSKEKSGVFQQVAAADRVDYPALEATIQKWWDDKGVLRMYLQRNQHSDKQYSFLDGPITANNPMGVHHAWDEPTKICINALRPCRATSSAIRMASIARDSGLRSRSKKILA